MVGLNEKLTEMIEDCGLEVSDVEHIIKEAQAQVLQSNGFVVIAGKHDDEGMNCKYSSDLHLTLEAAIKDYDRVSSYPWAYIEYNGRVLEVWGSDVHPLQP